MRRWARHVETTHAPAPQEANPYSKGPTTFGVLADGAAGGPRLAGRRCSRAGIVS
jgi:hypothetical protein